MPHYGPEVGWPVGNANGLTMRPCGYASSFERPMLIFAPGFLSECDPDKPYQLIEWQEQIERVVLERDYAACMLFWPSQELSDLLAAVMPIVLQRIVAWGAAIPWVALPLIALPLATLPLMALRFGIPLATLMRVRKVWKKAVDEADAAGRRLAELSTQSHRPLILVGHSLGARLVLRAAIESPAGRYQAMHAFAPAVTLDPWDVRLAAASVSAASRLTIFYSHSDYVLSFLYRLGELTATAPLGYSGPPKGVTAAIDAVDCSASKTGHLDYRQQMALLMNSHLA